MDYKAYFDEPISRAGTYSLKWDIKENELPMWVADMDFRTAPEIIETLAQRVNHGIFGYSIVPNEWHEAICNWWERRHHFHIESNWILFATGVVPILSSVVRKLTTVGENIVIQTPVYNIFFNSILNNGRNVIECPLVYDGTHYTMDFDKLEACLAMPQTTMMIICNPHNPVGKIWSKEELQRVGELCQKYHVIVVSDEIHCDITDPNKTYTPFASVSEVCRNNSITCVAPTKAFNLAGLQTAVAIVPDTFLRHKVNRGLNTDEVAEPNAFAIQATIAAFNHGEKWLDALRDYLYQNKQIVKSYLEAEIPELKLVPSEATYLLWIDTSKICKDSRILAEYIRQETGLYLSDGVQYGKTGESFLRMNIACSQIRLQEGLKRLKEGIQAYLSN